MARIVNIKNDVIVGRVYKLYNSYDEYIYIGSTTLTLSQRLKSHLDHVKRGVKTNLYEHLRKLDMNYWTMELLEAKFVDNITELRSLEQKHMNRYNKDVLLNQVNVFNSNEKVRLFQQHYRSMNKDELNRKQRDRYRRKYSNADSSLLDELISETSQLELTNLNDENED